MVVFFKYSDFIRMSINVQHTKKENMLLLTFKPLVPFMDFQFKRNHDNFLRGPTD
jgi:hypothetical protein